MRPLRVLVVDDQKLFVESLSTVLKMEKALIKQVFVVSDGEEAVRAVDRIRPDVVLMDVFMPNMDGIEATCLIHQKNPDIKIVLLSAFGYDEYVQKAIENGAAGYILKDITPEDLVNTIRVAYRGGVILPPRNVSSLFRQRRDRAAGNAIPDWLKQLSAKERKILLLISKGYSNKEIAKQVYLGDQTIRNYISSIYSKLDVQDRFEAMRKAIEARIDYWVVE